MARDPKAEVEITAHSRNLAARLREARAKFNTFGTELKKNIFGKDVGKSGFLAKAGASFVGNLGSSGVGALGGFLEEQGKAVYEYQDQLVRLKIAGNATGAEITDLDRRIRHASDTTGISKQSIVGAARQYVALTGDIAGASDSIESWTRVAQASDTAIADVASTAQAMRDNLKIKPGEMEAAFDVLIGQGKSGAIEMKDLASQLAIVSPMMAQFGGGTGVQGLRDLGATVQVVRKGFGGAEETITGVQSLMTALIKNAGRFQKAGVKVFDVDPKTGAKHLKSFREIIDAISTSKLMKDPTKLEKAFGRVEAFRAFLQLKDNKAELDQLADSSEYAGVTQRDLATYSQSTAGKLTIAWEKAKNKIAEVFTPDRIETFANALVKAADYFAKIVGFVDHLAQYIQGAPDDVHQKNAEQDLFLDKSAHGDEAGAVALAKKTLAASNSQQIFGVMGAAKDVQYGGLANMQKAAQRFLEVNGPTDPADRKGAKFESGKGWRKGGKRWNGTGWSTEGVDTFGDSLRASSATASQGGLFDIMANLPKAAGLGGVDSKTLAKDFARELASELKKAGVGKADLSMDGSKVSHAVLSAGGIQAAGRTRPGG